jgi:hypothetical protein
LRQSVVLGLCEFAGVPVRTALAIRRKHLFSAAYKAFKGAELVPTAPGPRNMRAV